MSKTKEQKLDLLYTNWRDLEIGFFDIEACDRDPLDEKNDIIQFSILKFKEAKQTFEYNIYIQPRNQISEQATIKAHGLTNEMLKEEPFEDDPCPDDPSISVIEFINNTLRDCDVLCAYNGLGYDKPFLNRIFEKYDLKDINDIPFIDPFLWFVHSKGKFSGTKQEDAARQFNVNILGNVAHGEAKLHDSLTDIKALHELTFKMGVNIISAYTLKDLMTMQDRLEKKIKKERDKKFGSKSK